MIDMNLLTCDIIERKISQDRLRVSEENLQLLVSSVREYAIFMLDIKGRVASWNRGAEVIKGYKAQEIIGQHFSRFYTSEDLEDCKPERELQIAIADGRYEEEGWRLRKDGSRFWANVVITALFDEDGELRGFSKVMRDLTERKIAEDKLRESEEVSRLLVASVKDYAIFMLDPNGQIMSWNKGAELIKGYQAKEIIGQHFSRFYTSEDLEDCKPERELQIAITDGHYQEEGWRLRKDGSRFWANVVITPLFNENGELRGFSKVTCDVTERKIVEENLRLSEANLLQKAQELEKTLNQLYQTQAQLIQKEKMSSLGQLVAGVAHEINNPVSFISGNLIPINDYTEDLLHLLKLYKQHYPNPHLDIHKKAEAIDLEFLIEDFPKLLSSMKIGTERIQNIVLALRNFSRVDEAEVKEVDIHEGIDGTLMILQNRLKTNSKYSEIQLVKEYGNLPLVECYAGQLNQVFMNILTNAIDAIEELNQQCFLKSITVTQNFIKISTHKFADKIVIAIYNSGLSISKAIISKIFDPFFTTKDVGKGTGLGLSICYQIITVKHRGQIWCDSTSEQGTKFVIELPLKLDT